MRGVSALGNVDYSWFASVVVKRVNKSTVWKHDAIYFFPVPNPREGRKSFGHKMRRCDWLEMACFQPFHYMVCQHIERPKSEFTPTQVYIATIDGCELVP